MLVEIRHVDLRNFEATIHAFRDVDCIYHLAARVGSIEYSHEGKHEELEALQTNLLIDTNGLGLAQL
jgi:nucleoside-diphosphate-sugar epimerase